MPPTHDIEFVWHDLKAYNLPTRPSIDIAASTTPSMQSPLKTSTAERMSVPLAKPAISA